jgi:large subunit ribosomal protein L32
MAVPKKRVSRSVRNQRRAHDFLTPTAALEACPSCGATKERHKVCPSCGTYRGRQVISMSDVDVAAADAPPPTE